METRRPVAIGILLLGVLAIAATAGMYAEQSDPSFGSGALESGGTESGNDPVGFPPWVVSNFYTILLGASVVFLVVATLVVLWLKGREGLVAIGRFVGEHALGFALAIALFMVGKWALVYFSTGQFAGPVGGAPPGGAAGGAGAGGATASGETIPTRFILLGIFVLLGVLMHFAFQRTGSSGTASSAGGGRSPPPEPVEETDEPTVTIEDVPKSNAIYRAWREMATRAVEASDRTATSSEIARLSVREGFDSEAVRTLTDLFEEVRYGDRPVTAERERKAEAALQSLDGPREARE